MHWRVLHEGMKRVPALDKSIQGQTSEGLLIEAAFKM
jgi:hypothetical protein